MLSSIHLLTHRLHLHRVIQSIVVVIIRDLPLCFNRTDTLVRLLFSTSLSLVVVVLGSLLVVLLDRLSQVVLHV